MAKRTYRICCDCGLFRPHHGRGQCDNCYTRLGPDEPGPEADEMERVIAEQSADRPPWWDEDVAEEWPASWETPFVRLPPELRTPLSKSYF